MTTVGLNEAAIRKYIQDQEKDDIALDKLSVKEYEDPFKRKNGAVSKRKRFEAVFFIGKEGRIPKKQNPKVLLFGIIFL